MEYRLIASVLVETLVFTRNITSISKSACYTGDIMESIISSYGRWGLEYWFICSHSKLINCLSMKYFSLSGRLDESCLLLFSLWWGIHFTHSSGTPPVDRPDPDLSHCRESEEWETEYTICCYLVLNGLRHIHNRAPALYLFVISHLALVVIK